MQTNPRQIIIREPHSPQHRNQRHILMTIGDNTQPIQGDLYLRLTIQVSNALYFDWNADTI